MNKDVNKNEMSFSKGDVVFNTKMNRFIYIFESNFDKSDKDIIEFNYMVIGSPSKKVNVKESIESLSLNLTRYGNVSDVNISLDKLKKFDITAGNPNEQGLRVDKLNKNIMLNFLMSY